MRPDGGEAREITDAKDGVVDFSLESGRQDDRVSRGPRGDARSCLACRSQASKPPKPEPLTKQPAGVDSVGMGAGRQRASILVTADKFDEDEKARRDKKFTVNIRNAETPTVEPLGAGSRSRQGRAR